MKNKTLPLSVESICTIGQGSVNIAGVTFRLTAFTIMGVNRTIVEVFVGITPIIQLAAIQELRGVLYKTIAETIEDYLRLVEKRTNEEIEQSSVRCFD